MYHYEKEPKYVARFRHSNTVLSKRNCEQRSIVYWSVYSTQRWHLPVRLKALK